MNQGDNYGIPAHIKEHITEVLMDNKIDPSLIEKAYFRDISLGETFGTIAVIIVVDGDGYAVSNVPVLVKSDHDRQLTANQLMGVIVPLTSVPGGCFVEHNQDIYFKYFEPISLNDEKALDDTLEELHNKIVSIRSDLLSILHHQYPEHMNEQDSYPEPNLPNIKMLPKDMYIIYGILSHCNDHAQRLYVYLMEMWARKGYFVKTTSQSITLDIPYGPNTHRLAMLLPERDKDNPTIVLFWNSLYKSEGFPRTAIIEYQKAIRNIIEFRTTESSAHLKVDESFHLQKARKLFNAMSNLAQRIEADKIGNPAKAKGAKLDNIQETLLACAPSVRNIFELLMHGWKGAGGAIQSRRVGIIYLRMKTHEHKSGNYARIARNFSLITMSVSGRVAYIQVSWALSQSEYSAYLDCIPKDVSHFEAVVSALPGFEQKGTINRLVMSDAFNINHAQSLLDAILKLKAAEISAA